MNKNTQTKSNEMRFVCDNWDEPEVRVYGHGKGHAAARKVVTRETIVINANELFRTVYENLRKGNEVRLADEHCGEWLRIVPMMDASLTKMFVEARTMGIFRTWTLSDKRAKFTRRGTDVSLDTAQSYDWMKRNQQTTKFEEVTPDMTVTCPKCKYTFRVGRRNDNKNS